MSKVVIAGDASGTGTFTISAPNGNTDRTLVLPDEAGTVLTSASVVAASQITTALNATGSAPIYAARAWVNFNGTGTVAIREAGNVSSITDNGTGDYTVNFTTAFTDNNYAISTSYGTTSGSIALSSPTTTSVSIQTYSNADAAIDRSSIGIVVFR